MLSNHKATKKLTHMLTRCMGEEETIVVILALLPELDEHHVSREKHTGREFNMTVELGSYKMDGVMLDPGSNVNILSKKS